MIGKFMSEASAILQNPSNCSRSKVLNHSARKTSISSLLNNNIHPLHVSKLSGHKNLESLNSYHSASRKQQERMSDIINSNDERAPLKDISCKNCSISNTSSSSSFSKYKNEAIFNGATINNCVLNINIQQQQLQDDNPSLAKKTSNY